MTRSAGKFSKNGKKLGRPYTIPGGGHPVNTLVPQGMLEKAKAVAAKEGTTVAALLRKGLATTIGWSDADASTNLETSSRQPEPPKE